MLQQVHRASHRAIQARGQRLRQPQVKEERKAPMPRDVITMLDGTQCTTINFHDLRSNAHKKLKDDFTGIAQRIRLSVTEHEDVWETIMDWVNQHRPAYGNPAHQNDTLVALVIVYAANRFKRPIADIITDIERKGYGSAIFPTRSS